MENKRRALLGLQFAGRIFLHSVVETKLRNNLAVLEYAEAAPSTRPRIPVVNVPEHVAAWTEAIVGMTLASDKATVDAWEHKMDDLLLPFIKCPVKQIREFCTQLAVAIEQDTQIPWLIKHSALAYLKLIVGEAKDTKIIELKRDIATRIAQAVEGDVGPQLPAAIANALMWRDPATLERIESKLKQGHKAKMTGKESCLFLEVDDESVML